MTVYQQAERHIPTQTGVENDSAEVQLAIGIDAVNVEYDLVPASRHVAKFGKNARARVRS